MLTIKYEDKNCEIQAGNLIGSDQPFMFEVGGLKGRLIDMGLSIYLRYLGVDRGGRKRRLFALLMIPFALLTPTFWVICVKASFAGFYPMNHQQAGRLLRVEFDKLKGDAS